MFWIKNNTNGGLRSHTLRTKQKINLNQKVEKQMFVFPWSKKKKRIKGHIFKAKGHKTAAEVTWWGWFSHGQVIKNSVSKWFRFHSTHHDSLSHLCDSPIKLPRCLHCFPADLQSPMVSCCVWPPTVASCFSCRPLSWMSLSELFLFFFFFFLLWPCLWVWRIVGPITLLWLFLNSKPLSSL